MLNWKAGQKMKDIKPIKKPDVETSSIEVTFPREGVALIRILSEPLGVLRIAVKRAMLEALASLEANSDVRCLVITGTGRAFSAGSDVRDFTTDAGWLLESEIVEGRLNSALEHSHLPVIAACNGITLGGGNMLALACDIRIAAESARFGFPEVKVGALATGTCTLKLPRFVGRSRALELILTGRVLSSLEARNYGLVEEVVPDKDLMERALGLAAEIADTPPLAIQAHKYLVNTGLELGYRAGLSEEWRLAVEVGQSDDAIEGQRAFLEKRPPVFSYRKKKGTD
jgi:enoyl-CoA hydratase/carnithine racemase